MNDELTNIMIETQKQYKKSNKLKDKIIILLTVLMFAEAVIFTVVLFGMKVNSIMFPQIRKK